MRACVSNLLLRSQLVLKKSLSSQVSTFPLQSCDGLELNDWSALSSCPQIQSIFILDSGAGPSTTPTSVCSGGSSEAPGITGGRAAAWPSCPLIPCNPRSQVPLHRTVCPAAIKEKTLCVTATFRGALSRVDCGVLSYHRIPFGTSGSYGQGPTRSVLNISSWCNTCGCCPLRALSC